MIFTRCGWALCLAGALIAVFALPISAAKPQTDQQFDSCRNSGGLLPRDQQITGCTAIIQSRRSSARDLLWALHNRGYAYYRKYAFERAIADFSEAIRISPADADVLNARCWLRTIVGRELRQALDDCNESLRLRANDAATLDSRGFTCLKLGQFNNAIADYDAALALDSRQAESYFGRGVAKLKAGNVAGGNADIAAARAIQADIADEFAKYGVKLDGSSATIQTLSGATSADCARAVAQRRGEPLDL
jgi:tetratricopeptide (TPR) repeat protein